MLFLSRALHGGTLRRYRNRSVKKVQVIVRANCGPCPVCGSGDVRLAKKMSDDGFVIFCPKCDHLYVEVRVDG